jgi:chorismate mutase
MVNQLECLRQQIHDIDREIVRLLSERFQLALKIGQIKTGMGIPFFDRNREKEVISNVLKMPHAPLDEKSLEELFQHILQICREAQMNVHPQKAGE